MSLIAILAKRCHVAPWLIEALLAAILLCAFVLYERHQGARGCELKDQQQATKQEARNAALQAQGTTTIYQEAQDYHEAIAAPIARPVRLRACPNEVLPAPTSSAGADASPPSSGPSDGASVPSESTGPELQAVGRDGDAQIRGLQDYIRKVCLVR